MKIVVAERFLQDGIVRHRLVAEWALPKTDEPIECAFTQLATPDTTKVVTYRIAILPDPK